MMNKKTTIFAAVAVLATAASANAFFGSDKLTKEEVLQAQEAWAQGIVTIGKAKLDGGDYRTAAKKHIENLYAYGETPVLFKPTKAVQDQFRGTFDEALSYFVGGIVPEDSGFAINPWTAVRFENEGMMIDDDSATAMGNYYFTTLDGTEVKVEYTFGYVRGDDGNVRINVHHSSVPFAAS